MALRFKLPASAGRLAVGKETRVVPAMRPAETVCFKLESDMVQVARQALAHSCVKLCAAVGTGKSTRIPGALALEGRRRVYYVTANPMLVRHQYQYRVKLDNECATGPEVFLYSGSLEGAPKIGIVYISASELVALMLQNVGHEEQFLRGSVVMLDEAHESNAYTHVVRTLALAVGASNLVMASATFDVAGFRRRETPSSVIHRTYGADETPESWHVTDVGKPWTAATVSNNILIFVDSDTVANDLLQAYRDNGFFGYRLHADMTAREFDEAMVALNDKNGPMVALAADYSFRSGFTFPVSHIVDTGRVYLMDPTPGRVAKVSRELYKFEVEQSAGRAGRTQGANAVYYLPDNSIAGVQCQLEAVDVEAAALLFRCLGFKPTGDLANTLAATYDLESHVDLGSALRSPYPLSCYYVEDSGDIRQGVVRARYRVHSNFSAAPSEVSSPVELSRPVSGPIRTLAPETARSSSGERSYISARGGAGSRLSSAGESTRASTDAASMSRSASGSGYERSGTPVTVDSGFSDRDGKGLSRDFNERGEADARAWYDFARRLGEHSAVDIRPGRYYYCPAVNVDGIPTSSLGLPDGLASLMRVSGDGGLNPKYLNDDDKACAMRLVLDEVNKLNVEIEAKTMVMQEKFVRSNVPMTDPNVVKLCKMTFENLTIEDGKRRALLDLVTALTDSSLRVYEFDGLPRELSLRIDYYRTLFDQALSAVYDTDSGVYVDSFSRDVRYPKHKLKVTGPATTQRHVIKDSEAEKSRDAVGHVTTTVSLPFWLGGGRFRTTAVGDKDGKGEIVRTRYEACDVVRRLTGVATKTYDHERNVTSTRYTSGEKKVRNHDRK